MGFAGDLGDIGLNDVFHNITTNRLSGTLHIATERRNLHVYFVEGKVSMAASLTETGPVSPSDDPARRTGGGARKKPGRRSIRARLKDEGPEGQAFRKAIREQILEPVFEVFAWTESRFEFNEGEPPADTFPPEQEEAALGIEVEPILMEAARRTDEWARIHRQIRSLDEVFVPVAGLEEEGPPENELTCEVLAALDGRTDLQAIIETRAEGRFAVCKAVSDLLRDRWIRPLTLEERIKLAEHLGQAGEDDRAVRVLTAALEHERNEPTLHLHLGELHEKAGRAEDAAQAYNLAARAFQALGQEDDARHVLARAVHVAPTDPGIRERLLEVLLERHETEEALRCGLDLAELYTGIGLADKARSTYIRLTSLAPDDTSLLVALAHCERNLGNAREAVKILRTVVTAALKHSDLDQAKTVLKEILKIQPDHAEAKRLIGQMESGEHALRRDRRKRQRQLVAWCLGAGVIVYALAYEVLAHSKLHTIQRQNTGLIAQGRFLQAIQNYHSLRNAYPFSLARLESGMLIEELARSQLSDVEKQAVVENPDTTIERLERILTLAVAPDVYERARRQITRLRVQKRVQRWVADLGKSDRHDTAHQALQELDDPHALDVVEKLLDHDNPEVRILMLRPLINLKSFRSIPLVIECLKDPDNRVRKRALDTLLILTQHVTPEISHTYWLDWWRNVGRQKFQ